MIFTGYYALTFWWILFFSVHSILAAGRSKRVIYRLGLHYQTYYRAVYNMLSLVLLIPVVYTYQKTLNEEIFTSNEINLIAGIIFIGLGIYVIIDSFKNYHTAEFIGTYQIKTKQAFHPTKFSQNGWNDVVRHPLYFGSIILIIGLCLATPNLKMVLSSSLALFYLVIGSYWEEKKLLNDFGDRYKEYQQQVSMLLPIKYVVKRLRQ